ncbi:hypothetical protein FOXG_22237 [Fusarium oxysporum f. sp. lycopersici 4287]|uniref:Uncharacterized protein n=2 Tax=Fusarium oxysporum TaxID=5507 RepID=A0A0J9W6D2_FUSO4|nr:hypothetical protein FOXG_22237 [Fusarium oxysporum f. sp. lycopersici 4287]EXK26394.1 hypothetical protein FOMG_17008 [Fusarium oxysporum f. sp. melonis 26406]KNB18443.1 hypothetical protein FOXG_22237 [Fusarium oxysporum f. sp. lycopersici 4287]
MPPANQIRFSVCNITVRQQDPYKVNAHFNERKDE